MNRLFSRRPHRRSYRNGLVQGTTGTLFFALIVFLIALGVLRFVAPGVLSMAAAPAWRLGASATDAVGSFSLFTSRVAVTQERDRLASENTALTARTAALQAQVDDLTLLLGSRTAPEPGIVASVLARPPVAPYDVLIIDQGTGAGVRQGALVTGPGGTPIGTVGVADSRGGRVALFSTSGIETAAWAGAGRIPLTLTGKGAGAFSATVLREAGVAVGDGVYVAASGAFPIGTVTGIEDDPSSPSVVLNVRPYTNPFSLTWVVVQR